jgi:hypothetical protein
MPLAQSELQLQASPSPVVRGPVLVQTGTTCPSASPDIRMSSESGPASIIEPLPPAPPPS